jgi:hypothetical protein
LYCTFPSRPLLMYACLLLFSFLYHPGEQRRSKDRSKGRPRPRRQPRAKAAAAEAATVAAACRPMQGARIQSAALAFARSGGEGSRCSRACEAYLTQTNCGGPFLRTTSALS